MKSTIFLLLSMIISVIICSESESLPQTYTRQSDVQLTQKMLNLGFSSDQKYLIVLSQMSTGEFYLFDGRRKKNKQTIKIQDPLFDISPQCFSFSKDNRMLFIGTKQGVVYGFDIINDKVTVPFSYRYQVTQTAKQNWLRSISVSIDNYVAIGAQQKVVILELIQHQLKLKQEILFDNTDVYNVAWSSDPKDNLLIGGIGQLQGVFAIYSLSSNKTTMINTLKTFSVAYFPKGDYFLQGQLSYNITIYESKTNSFVETINGSLAANEIFVNYNGQRIGAQLDKKNIAVWKVIYNTSSSILNLQNHIQNVPFNIVNTLLAGGQNLGFSRTGNQILLSTSQSAITTRYDLCIDGQYFDQQKNQCGSCEGNCLTCYGNGKVCQSCSQYSFLDGNQCINCSVKYSGCLTCLEDGSKCQTCNQTQNWKENATIQGKCICKDSYFQDNGKCQSCLVIPDCLICDSSTNCIKCKDQAYFDPLPKDGKCICLSGYIMHQNKCQACANFIVGCLTCKSQKQCTLCNSEALFDPTPIDGKCVCKSTYFMRQSTCIKCDQSIFDCKTCSADGKTCNECQSQNRVPNNDHTKCICSDFYFDQNNVCKQCDQYQKCVHCNNTQTCQQCNSKQHWILNKNTQKCQCQPGYYEKNNKCVKCVVKGCQKCDDQFTCLQCSKDKGFNPIPMQNKCYCQSGRYPNPDMSECLSCSSFIIGCVDCTNDKICTKCNQQQHFIPLPNKLSQCDCKQTYYKDQTDKKCLSCSTNIQHCLNCGIQSGKVICYQCIDGYEINNDKTKCISKSSGLGWFTIVLIVLGALVIIGALVYLTHRYRIRRRSPLLEGEYQPLDRNAVIRSR